MYPYYFSFWEMKESAISVLLFATCAMEAIEKIEKRYDIDLSHYHFRFVEIICGNCDKDGFLEEIL